MKTRGNDGGRLSRPVLRVRDSKALITQDIIRKLAEKELSWNDLLTNCVLPDSVIEYIDPEEQNFSMIAAMKVKDSYVHSKDSIVRYTLCEIHPSTIFGILASCIPFPEHNQSPRNTYQCCMGKQAIGVYALNYDMRMDKTAYVLSYPSRPLVDTRLMNFIKLDTIPSGHQIHVAIMSHTGYNQEDSVLVNKGSIDRGLFMATIYHTEKDEDKNITRDEIRRCKPEPEKTKGLKFGNYEKIDKNGFIPENSLVENRDIIIANKLYGFTAGKPSKFVKLIFKNIAVMNKVKNYWYDNSGERKMIRYISQQCNIELYESNLPPLLRYFHIYNISPSGWIFIRTDVAIKIPENKKMTTCNFEYICNVNQIIPQSNKETIVPYKICSFDIEASSSHGDFPIPIKTYKRLAANLVDVHYKQKRHFSNSKEKSILFIEKMLYTAFGFNECQDIDMVYPKDKTLNKSQLSTLFKRLFEYNIYDGTGNKISSMMTIESMFSKIDDDEKLNNNENEFDNFVDEGDYEEHAKYPRKKTIVDIKETTIIDLLNSYDGKDRDDNVNKINEILTTILPPLEGDKVTFIGSTFVKFGEPEPYLNHCLVLGSCNNVDDVIIKTVNTEAELTINWVDLIIKEDPDIIIGYNIFGFDYEFLFRRSQETFCERKFLSLSRNVDEFCAKTDKYGIVSLENTKIVIATGEYDLRLLLKDVVLEPLNRELFCNILSKNYFPNLLIYGSPGCGKTTICVNLINEHQRKYNKVNKNNIIHLNASDERGIDIIRNQIYQFVKSKNLFEPGLKFVILDEVDYMTKNAQQALKYILQTSTNNVRFCLICNYITKIDESLKKNLSSLIV